MRALVFVVPGDWNTATGGYRYDRRIAAGLAAAGWQVERVSLGGGFPDPDATALAEAARRFDALPDGALVVVDGLAYGALPEIAERHAARLRWVALVHHPLWLETGLTAPRSDALRAAEQRALACARQVVVTSATTAADVEAMGVPAARIAVVEPGCDRPARLAPPAARPEGLQLLCVATLTPRKDHLALLHALAGLQDRRWSLHCVGSAERDADAAAAVHAAIRDLGLAGRVRLHGEFEEAELGAMYAAADAFVLPSRHEGYGMVFAEAMAHGLPVVACAAGAVPRTVPPDAGLLVPPGDVGALRDALARLLDDAALRERLRAGARRAAARLPGWDEAAARFGAALQEA